MMWQPFEAGHTIGQTGTEGGRIIRDEEHPHGARITLEHDCIHAPFAITCGIYGWMVHTCFFADQFTADGDFEQMKHDLDSIVALVPTEDSLGVDAQFAAVEEAISAFVERFE